MPGSLCLLTFAFAYDFILTAKGLLFMPFCVLFETVFMGVCVQASMIFYFRKDFVFMTTDYNTILEFDRIKEMLQEYAATDYAKEKINQMTPFLNELYLKGALAETDDARAILDFAGSPQVPDVSEAKTALDTAASGGILLPERLERFTRFIAAIRRLKSYLKKAETAGRSLAFCGGNLDTLDEVDAAINRCICGNDVDSSASKTLAGIRRQIDQTDQQVKAKLESLLSAKKKYCADSFVSMKNDRSTLPVKREYKGQVPGTVVAVSQTGTTCFIEPEAVATLNERLSLLHAEESVEKERILYTLTGLVDQYHAEIRSNIETVEAVDFAFAKGRLSVAMDAVSPRINTARKLKIVKGRHPLLERELCVPLDFELGEGIRGIVVTGPNTGGKTVALKTVGLFSLMAQCGLHLPCEEADICMNSNVLCDIGDGQNISQNLSTFSAHITNIVDILKNTGKESLVLLDELGSGTDPTEGCGIAIAVLEELRRRKCFFVATTHYAEVKGFAQNAPGLENARMTFDKETLRPLYRLVIGEAGESCALFIAKRLGFPPHLLQIASEQTHRVPNTHDPANNTNKVKDTGLVGEPSDGEQAKKSDLVVGPSDGKRIRGTGLSDGLFGDEQRKGTWSIGGQSDDKRGRGADIIVGLSDGARRNETGLPGEMPDGLCETDHSAHVPKIQPVLQKKELPAHVAGFRIGDSVTVYPEKKIGIVYQASDENGVVGVQVKGRKQRLNHKRLALKAPASQLYPPDYDFSILFDSVEERKARHQMERKYCPDITIHYEKETEEER